MADSLDKIIQSDAADLIAKLESASEGSRALSNEIAVAAGWQRDDARQFVWRSPDGQAYHVAPDFTRSLDAALTLVPEGLQWRVGYTGLFQASIYWGEFEQWLIFPANTPALALCIAALRARLA